MDIELKSTFLQDFNIADRYGAAAVKDTYKRSKDWLSDQTMWAELVIVLNHKIWQHYETNEPLARVYNDLWSEAHDLALDTYTGEDAATYYRMTD